MHIYLYIEIYGLAPKYVKHCPKPDSAMKKWIKKNKFALIILIPGAIGGYMYWYFIGCTTGTCPITSNPYGSIFYGVILGFLMGNFIDERRKNEQTSHEGVPQK